jgi:hypothetical protein
MGRAASAADRSHKSDVGDAAGGRTRLKTNRPMRSIAAYRCMQRSSEPACDSVQQNPGVGTLPGVARPIGWSATGDFTG